MQSIQDFCEIHLYKIYTRVSNVKNQTSPN